MLRIEIESHIYNFIRELKYIQNFQICMEKERERVTEFPKLVSGSARPFRQGSNSKKMVDESFQINLLLISIGFICPSCFVIVFHF